MSDPTPDKAVLPLTRNQVMALMGRARSGGISRRDLMKIFAVGGLGGVLAACERAPAPSASSGSELAVADLPWVKNPEPFIQHPTNLETRLELLDGVITPNELFFVRNHAPTPRIDASDYRLRIEGDAIDEAVEFTIRSASPAERIGGGVSGVWRQLEGLLGVGRGSGGGRRSVGHGRNQLRGVGRSHARLGARACRSPLERRRRGPDRTR